MSAPDQTDSPPVGLRRQAAGGARWTGLSAAITTVLQLTQLAVLGRLLGPEAFGIIAMVMIVVSLAQLLAEMGLSEALVQRQEPTRDELSSLYWTNVAFSVLLLFLVWRVTPLIAIGFDEPQLNALLPVAAFAFVILSFGVQFKALAQKNFHFRLLAAAEISNSAVALMVAVVSAWYFDQGVWSLVWGVLSGAGVRTAILVSYGWSASTRPRLHFRWGDLAGYLSFGLYRTGAMSFNFFNLRVAQLLVGVLFGAQALGYYSVGANFVLQPVQKLNPVLTKVAFPTLSRVQGDIERLRRGYLEMIRLLMLMNAPALVGVAAVAPTAIPFILGEQWTEAIPLVQILAFYALLRSLNAANGSLLMATGQANWAFYWSMAVTVAVVPAVYIASLTGNLIWVPCALLVVQLLLTIVAYFVRVRSIIGPCFVNYLRALGEPVLLAGTMGLIVAGVGILLGDIPEAARLSLQVSIGAISYVALLWVFRRKELYSMVKLAVTRG